MKYRSHIEGLRGVAILLVVAAHANVAALKGGFVGVDIFFVLSGFLITGLLSEEIEKSGSINLVGFFARRVKRLAPALFVLLFVISIVVVLFIAPYKQLEQIPSARSAALWYSNLYFAFTDFGYFDSDSSSSLFLHTWSLGVEEQFYLIWPGFLLYFYKKANELTEFKPETYLVLTLLKLIVVFLGFYLLMSFLKPIWAFYLMPTRIWEFALGAAVFFIGRREQNQTQSDIQNSTGFSVLGWLGLTLIAGSVWYLARNSAYPNVLLVLPSMGTALVLYAGEKTPNNHCRVTGLLSVSPLRWVGKISYSWYLWHWPVIVLGGTLFGIVGGYQMMISVAASLFLSFVSWYFVESPVRRSQYLHFKPGYAIAGAVMLSIVSVGGLHAWSNAAIIWRSSPEQSAYAFARRDVPRVYDDGCDDWYGSSQLKLCVYGSKDASNTVVLLGDSIGTQWFDAIEVAYRNSDWKLVVLTKSSCPIIDQPFYLDKIGRLFENCRLWRESAMNWIEKTNPNVVFIGNAKVNFNQEQWVEGTRRVLDVLTKAVDQVFILRPTPELSFGGGACLAINAWQKNLLPLGKKCSEFAINHRDKEVFSWLQESAGYYKNAMVIDMNPHICPQGECIAALGKTVIYRDKQHITASFSASLSSELAQKIWTP